MFPNIRKRLNKFIGISIMYVGISIDQLTPNIVKHIVEFDYLIPVLPMDPPDSIIYHLTHVYTKKRKIKQKRFRQKNKPTN